MPTIPLKTVSDLYQKARKKREWWHNGGRGYSAYMFTDGQFLLAHDGSVIFDYDPRKGTYAVSGSTPAAWSTLAATPLPSRVRPSSRCSLPT